MVKYTASLGVETIRLGFSPEDLAAGSIELTKSDLLPFIQLLGKAHQMLTIDDQQSFAEGTVDMNDAVVSPWRLHAAARTKQTTISFLHPAFGPMSFLVSPELAADLMQRLSLFLETRPCGSPLN